MKPDNPSPQTISVVIPAFNAESTIRRTIQSVLAQTLPPLEIIVVDDGSIDNTSDIVRSFGSQVQFITQKNAGAGAARNTGIRAAQGEWIAFLDADDEWLPKKLSTQIEILQNHPELVWMGSNFFCREIHGSRTAPDILPETVQKMLDAEGGFTDFFSAAAKGINLWTGTLLIRKYVFKDAGLFDESLHHGEEDTDLWWRIAYRHPAIGYSPEPLAVYSVDMRQSLTRKPRALPVFTNLFDKHIALAEKHHRMEAFRPAASQKILICIRTMLFENRGPDIRFLLRRYANLFSRSHRWVLYALTVFPSLTAKTVHGISILIRTFRLRRRVTPPPPKSGPEKRS